MSVRPLIALADPEWLGHRETYFRQFISSLHRVGADVIALCPSPERLLLGNAASGALHTMLFKEPDRLPLLNHLPQDPWTTRRRWKDLAAALDTTETMAGRPADLVFLPWLDDYLRASLDARWALGAFNRPWAGLYFRAHHLTAMNGHRPALLGRIAKGDRLLQAASCRGVATLDETLRPALEKASCRTVVTFPDITDESPPDAATPFAKRIRETARGRKVIGLIGMEPRKGVVTMLRTADLARAEGRPWLFVLAGVFCPDFYSEADRHFIYEHVTRSRDASLESNVLFPDEFVPVPDGPVFNGVMNSYDVLFVAYHDFLGSSNVLTKATVLKKPVVCTDLGCIAYRTKTYDLGLAIPQGDATACSMAIGQLLKGVNWNGAPLQPRYDDYHALHNREALDASMRQLIALI